MPVKVFAKLRDSFSPLKVKYQTVDVIHREIRTLKNSGVDKQTVFSGKQFQSGTVRWKKEFFW